MSFHNASVTTDGWVRYAMFHAPMEPKTLPTLAIVFVTLATLDSVVTWSATTEGAVLMISASVTSSSKGRCARSMTVQVSLTVLGGAPVCSGTRGPPVSVIRDSLLITAANCCVLASCSVLALVRNILEILVIM